jgi:hypothetical protein
MSRRFVFFIISCLLVIIASASQKAQGEDFITKGLQNLSEADFTQASEQFLKALQFGSLTSNDSAMAYTCLGIVAVARAQEGEAKLYFSNVFSINSNFKIEETKLKLYANQETLRLFEKVRTESMGGLNIKTQPPGLPVEVDNFPRGMSPVTVRGLTTGEHTIKVGHQQRKTIVKIGQLNQIEFKFTKPINVLEQDHLGAFITTRDPLVVTYSRWFRSTWTSRVDIGVGPDAISTGATVLDHIFIDMDTPLSIVAGAHVDRDLIRDFKTDDIYPGPTRLEDVFGLEYYFKKAPFSASLTISHVFYVNTIDKSLDYAGTRFMYGLNYSFK